jgi:hypothetical protein
MTDLAASWQTPRLLQNKPRELANVVTRYSSRTSVCGGFPYTKTVLLDIVSPLPLWDDGGVRGEGGARNERGEYPPIPPSV